MVVRPQRGLLNQLDRVLDVELLARLRAVLRRTLRSGDDERLSAGGVEVMTGSREVRIRGRTAELTGLEFDMLVALMRRPGRVIPRTSLMRLAGREDTVVSDRAVDVHVSHLRRKLGDDTRSPQLIKTVRGVGYVFSPGEPP